MPLYFNKYFVLSPIEHNIFSVCITTATCFGLSYRPPTGNTLHKTQACVPRNFISELANLREQYLKKKVL